VGVEAAEDFLAQQHWVLLEVVLVVALVRNP
jgi:hypothetical protein